MALFPRVTSIVEYFWMSYSHLSELLRISKLCDQYYIQVILSLINNKCYVYNQFEI